MFEDGERMTDTALLDEVIESKGIKYNFLARELGLSDYGFYKKRNGLTEFTVAEVVKLSKLLELPRDLRDQIFLL